MNQHERIQAPIAHKRKIALTTADGFGKIPL